MDDLDCRYRHCLGAWYNSCGSYRHVGERNLLRDRLKHTLVPKAVGISVVIIGVAILGAEALIAKAFILQSSYGGRSGSISDNDHSYFHLHINRNCRNSLWTCSIHFDVIISALPPAAALIFGTQMDLMRGWMFWTWNRKPTVTPQELTKIIRHMDAPPSPITSLFQISSFSPLQRSLNMIMDFLFSGL